MGDALEAGRVVDVEVDSIASDSLGAHRISALALYAAQHFDVRSILVDDSDIATARRALWSGRRLAVEYGAATALAGLTTGSYQPRPGERVCVVSSGADTGLSSLAG
ncbi:pyridoxal-phosphate dependent enzyme [Nocardia vinacea]|uniref:pyridoxal-phosphate dependent enzyme n=1 Tax=Nocardia vinacea TaxID=96468 RepID=UPI0033DE6B1F